MSFVKPASHLLLYSFAFGGATFYSYVASPLMFKTLEKDQFSKMQSKIFPGYFCMQTVTPVILGLTSPVALSKGSITCLLTAVASGLVNFVYLQPKSHKIKEERHALAARLEGKELMAFDEDLKKSFGRTHGISLLFNFTNNASMLVYGVYLAKNLLRYIPK
ncbi:hypothetical protein TPHA_0M01710 [Tetrapisispora phaffii CBS 4417]|uniref:TMEM205-like domain-containing protein n=1 Tax=Tetrapisispora phaffii (strain ATCC 24235 / CBS 4417 / NBRC 1672 / NRRL Y-8282 / UCD 70-5) TaxID=1071381 RepID=G8C0N1_TETPH|nr:hypothetical protein TPHA_0M01710 [Tetrapisispora phaffii CBS 4417]CCE65746.1 hypothetical protein TPHA_0M01710 [Tetrapisispora phaffii CBS 4417]